MVTGALAHLEATNKAYCLVVEGSRIDHGGHDNDAAASAWDALAYNDAFAAVLERTGAGAGGAGAAGGMRETQVVSVADHSTGGLTLGLQTDWEMKYDDDETTCDKGDACGGRLGTYPYGAADGWLPGVLAGATASHGYMAAQLCCNTTLRASPLEQRRAYIAEGLGFLPDEAPLVAIKEAQDRLAPDFTCHTDPIRFRPRGVSRGDACVLPTRRQLSLMVQRRAKVGFTSLG